MEGERHIKSTFSQCSIKRNFGQCILNYFLSLFLSKVLVQNLRRKKRRTEDTQPRLKSEDFRCLLTQGKSTESSISQALLLIDLNKSRGHYISLILLEFEGDFVDLPCDKSIQALSKLRVPFQFINIISTFLLDRSAQVNSLNPHYKNFFLQWLPMRFLSGPFLWKTHLETMLSKQFDNSAATIANADDVVLLFWEKQKSIGKSGSGCT